MAKLTDEETAQLEALTRRRDAPDEEEEDYEVVLEVDGKIVRMPYSKAKPLLKKWGFDIDDLMPEGAPEGEGEIPPGGEGEPPPEGDPKVTRRGAGYWRKEA